MQTRAIIPKHSSRDVNAMSLTPRCSEVINSVKRKNHRRLRGKGEKGANQGIPQSQLMMHGPKRKWRKCAATRSRHYARKVRLTAAKWAAQKWKERWKRYLGTVFQQEERQLTIEICGDSEINYIEAFVKQKTL